MLPQAGWRYIYPVHEVPVNTALHTDIERTQEHMLPVPGVLEEFIGTAGSAARSQQRMLEFDLPMLRRVGLCRAQGWVELQLAYKCFFVSISSIVWVSLWKFSLQTAWRSTLLWCDVCKVYKADDHALTKMCCQAQPVLILTLLFGTELPGAHRRSMRKTQRIGG